MTRRKGDKDYTDSEKKLLISLIKDYEVCEMSDIQIIQILSQRLGRSIKETSYYKLKKEANKNKLSSEEWLDNFVRFGLVDFYKKRIEEVEYAQQILLTIYAEEASKKDTDTKQNRMLMNQVAKTINYNSKVLSELGMGLPIIAKLKSLIPHEIIDGDLEYIEKYMADKKNKNYLSKKNEDNSYNEIFNPLHTETAILPPIPSIKDHKDETSGENATITGDQPIF